VPTPPFGGPVFTYLYMHHENPLLRQLFERWINGLSTPSEEAALLDLLDQDPANQQLFAEMQAIWEKTGQIEIPPAQKAQVLTKALGTVHTEPALSVHRVHFLRRGLFRYAAAVLIILCGVGGYFLINNKKAVQPLTNNNKSFPSDTFPGGDRAFLTLADGRVILLDSAANGNLAQQGNAAIIKLANGQIAYKLKGSAEGEVMMNTMATPKGGQYQLTLPDGSKVWLNAASSIQFPAAFTGTTRNVKITGEAYFEVTKNKEKPFIVDVEGKASVQVLGTIFNINSYADEGVIKSTLVEGSVRILNSVHHSVVLKPGQQAQINMPAIAAPSDRPQATPGSGDQIKVINNADIDQTLAWKNGIFNFDGLGVRAVMAQLARWYDIDVRYVGPMPANIFKGEMYRSAKLSFILDGLSKMGIKCRIDGKTVVVTQ